MQSTKNCCLNVYICKRKQENNDNYGERSTPFERIIFWILSSVILLALIWLYCWCIIGNEYNFVDDFFFEELGSWFHWYLLILCFTSVALSYMAIAFLSGCFRVLTKHQLHLNCCHKILFPLCAAVVVAGFVLIDMFWPEQFQLIAVSFQITGPFLQLAAVISWALSLVCFIRIFKNLSNKTLKVSLLLFYSAILIFLCSIPLWFFSPCIDPGTNRKPLIFAHRGADILRPENTILAYKKALEYDVFCFESDVRISTDGIPFLMHDDNLLRTTNVADIFPDRKHNRAETFSWSELSQLNAGQWFLNTNPYLNVHLLSSIERENISQQQIPSLYDYASLAKTHNKTVMFDLFTPPVGHPARETYVKITVETLLSSSLPQENVIWLYGNYQEVVNSLAPGFHLASHSAFPNASAYGIEYFNLPHQTITPSILDLGTKVIDYVSNDEWMFSRSWCLGVWAVTTDSCHTLSKVKKPLWTMSHSVFLGVWITIDLVVLIAVTFVFVFWYHRRTTGISFLLAHELGTVSSETISI